MIKGHNVRIKLRKHFREQRPMSYVGKVTSFSEEWVVLEARGIMLSRQQPNGVQIDAKASAMMIPRDNIESIRILPSNYDLGKIEVSTEGQQLVLVIEGAPNAFLGELGEG